VIGEDVVCVERDLSQDELDTAIADGSQPIVRRAGIVIALRKKELRRIDEFSRPRVSTKPNVPRPLPLKPLPEALKRHPPNDEIKRLTRCPDDRRRPSLDPPPERGPIAHVRHGNRPWRALHLS
jgi:hypothetical protein